MSFLAKLTITPLLWACGLLLVALTASTGYAVVLDARLGAAQADVQAAQADTRTARTERDAWKLRVDDLAAANAGYGTVVNTLTSELYLAQAETRRIDAAGKLAVANARAAFLDADAALAAMTAQLQAQARMPECERVLAQLAHACPAFEGY